MRDRLLIVIFAALGARCIADAFVVVPTPVGQFETGTAYPFLIKELSLTSMRFQQVYDASAFKTVDPTNVYVSTIKFALSFQNPSQGWTISSMQINLSTTQRSSDDLSTNFTDNVGPDDTVVFGPASYSFPPTLAGGRLPTLVFDKPFRYNAASGNLLLDVRIFSAGGSRDISPPALDAENSPTDQVSIVWATNVNDTVASGSDTLGLVTLIQFSPVPSLRLYISNFNTATTYVAVEWPDQPSVFRLQQASDLGSNAVWQFVANANPPRYYYPLDATAVPVFYRLVWESGQPFQTMMLTGSSGIHEKRAERK